MYSPLNMGYKKFDHFKVFYFTCNESKIYESFTFWNNLQEKIYFFTIFLIYEMHL